MDEWFNWESGARRGGAEGGGRENRRSVIWWCSSVQLSVFVCLWLIVVAVVRPAQDL